MKLTIPVLIILSLVLNSFAKEVKITRATMSHQLQTWVTLLNRNPEDVQATLNQWDAEMNKEGQKPSQVTQKAL